MLVKPPAPPPAPAVPPLPRSAAVNWGRPRESTNPVWIFVIASVLLHLLLVLLIFSGVFSRIRIPDIKPKPEKITLTLVPLRPPPPAPAAPERTPFLDTTALPTLEKPDPLAAFEGETNTAAMSRQAGSGNPALPNQEGEVRPGMEFFNSQYSPEQPTPATPPPAPETPESTKGKPVEPSEASSRPGLKESLRTGAQARVQTGEKEKESPDPTREPSPSPTSPSQASPAQKTEPTTPPAAFSAYKRENRIEGGASRGDANSAAARESDIGRYKARLYRAIGSRWYAYIHQDTGTIGVGIVRLRFFVRNDGVILAPEVIQGMEHSALLAVSRRSVMEVSGQLEPFPENMRQQLGEGYYEEVSFSIY